MVKHAVILAGGRGERLRPLTESKPKCMIEFLGTPIMAYQLNWLRTYGIEKVVIACGYMHTVIKEYFGNGAKMNIAIEYLVENEPLGRGGGLKAAMKQLGKVDTPIIAANGDNISNLSIADLKAFHDKHGPLATIVTTPLRSPFGIVETDGTDTVTGFSEKPELPYGINAGIYCLDPKIIEYLPDNGDHETSTFPELASQGQLKAFKSNAFWRTVDTIKDVEQVRGELENIFLGALFQRVQ